MKYYRDLSVGDVITISEPCTVTVIEKSGRKARVMIATERGAVAFGKAQTFETLKQSLSLKQSLRQLTPTHMCQTADKET